MGFIPFYNSDVLKVYGNDVLGVTSQGKENVKLV